MAGIEVQNWTGGFFAGAGSYNVGLNDNDDMLGVFIKPLRIKSITITNAGGYFHNHGGNVGVVSLRIAGTGTYVEIFRQPSPGDYLFNNLVNLLVPAQHRSTSFDGLRFQSVPAVNQGMHGVTSFTVNISLASSDGPLPSSFSYGSGGYGGGAPVVQRGVQQAQIVASAGATASMGMAVAKLPADIVVRASTPNASDVILDKSIPKSFDLGAAGRSTVTMGQGTRHRSEVYPMAGQSQVSAAMGLVKVEVRAASDGVASITDNRLLVIKSADRFTIYQSRPPYEVQDVLMGTKEGPGAEQGLSMASFAKADGSFTMGATIFSKARVDARGGGILSMGVSYTVKTTSNGQAGARDNYLSGPVRLSSVSNGRGGGFNYLGTPIRMTGISRGIGGGSSILGGTTLMPNTVMRGVAHWSLGERFLYTHVMAGVGHVNDIHLGGTARIATRSNGVGVMRENAVLLNLVSRGSSAGTEFDKPPFAFVVWAGCNSFGFLGGSQYGGLPGGPLYLYDNRRGGVFAYLSSPVRFTNNTDSCWRQDGSTSKMAGRSTFTFPYEMVAKADAGCRAFHGYLADYDYGPRPTARWDGWHGNHNQGMTGPSGVFATQIGTVYLQGRTNSGNANGIHSAGAYVTAYMSSRVYQGAIARGLSNAFFRRIDEFDVFAQAGGEWTMGITWIRLSKTTANGVADWSNNYIPDIRLLHTTTRGVANGWATQAGKVHFGPGLVTSRGIGHFFIDPGLMVSRSNGVGRMLDIERPDKVFMRWGSGQWYYEWHFPYIAPLLIPNGSNGMSRVEIEEKSTGVIHHHMDGVGQMLGTGLEGIEKGMTNQVCQAGSYDWTEVRKAEPSLGITGIHHPGKPYYGGTYHPQGVEMAFPVVEVVWAPAGVGKMDVNMLVHYLFQWQNWFGDGSHQKGSLPYTSNDVAYDDNGVLRPASGRAGAVGRFWIRPEPRFTSIARGRADILIRSHTTAAFAMNLFANGIARMLRWDLGGGSPPLDRYGNMLRYFFIPIPTYGQIWPRKERQHGQPV